MRLRHAIPLIGFVLAAVGVWRDDRTIVWAAIVVLGIAFLLRLAGLWREQTPPRGSE